jgi:hypothetical protein
MPNFFTKAMSCGSKVTELASIFTGEHPLYKNQALCSTKWSDKVEANPESRSDFQFAGTYLTGASLCDAHQLKTQNSDSLSSLKKLTLGCTLLQRADFINMISP